jgi:hypothetical protein
LAGWAGCWLAWVSFDTDSTGLVVVSSKLIKIAIKIVKFASLALFRLQFSFLYAYEVQHVQKFIVGALSQ